MNCLFRRSPRRRRGVLRLTATTVFWSLNLCCTNAGVKLPRVARSAWTTCYARPWFWPWFCRCFCVLTLIALNPKNITAQIAQCQLLLWHQQILCFETQKNWPPLKQTNWNYLQFYLPQKPPIEFITQKNNPPKLPPQRIFHETEYQWNREFTDLGFCVLIFGFCITPELSCRA